MPSKSAKQHRFMEAAAHDAGFAKKAGMAQGVAKDFVAADEKKERSVGKREAGTAPRPMPQKITKTPTHGYGR